MPTRVASQIVPDSTLGREVSTVVPGQAVNNLPSDIISGGAVRGKALFHSFQEFNIRSDQAAYFANPASVSNIITRVTGGSPSNILGTLGVLGGANFFLINPQGITFGPSAKLDLNGSFLATTADSVIFPEGLTFSAKTPEGVPLLTIKLPSSLDFSGGSGDIAVQGPGHNLVQPPTPFLPENVVGPLRTGLEVKPGNSISLIGGDVTFTDGIATAPLGSIHLGSVDKGRVAISQSLTGFSLNYDSVQTYNDILLSRASLLNASGPGGGNIHVAGNNITLANQSLAYILNIGNAPAGKIDFVAQDVLTLDGVPLAPLTPANPDLVSGFTSSGILSKTFSHPGADISIKAQELYLRNGIPIYASTFGQGSSGSIVVEAPERIQLDRPSPLNSPFAFSNISTATAGTGAAADLILNTRNLSLLDGSQISSVVFGSGLGGNVTINSDFIRLNGSSPILFPSLLASITLGSGTAGELVVNTRQLTIQNGGRVDSSSLGTGASGSVLVNASDFVILEGEVPGSINPSLIISSANAVDNPVRRAFNLPPVSTGTSGRVTINTLRLQVKDGAQVTVRNDGLGDAGNLQVNAEIVDLVNRGGITASTSGGNGGNIELNIGNLLLLRNESFITAAAQKSGNGGNVIIDPNAVVLLGNSLISANAEQGQGGRVSITTRGLFISPDSAISATSALGPQFSGIVEINASNQDFARAATLPTPPPQAPETSSVCQGRPGAEAGQLVKAGTGGIPRSPDDLLNKHSGWREQPSAAAVQAAVLDNPADPEVQGWIIYPDRTMQFITEPGVFYSTTATLPCRSTTVNR